MVLVAGFNAFGPLRTITAWSDQIIFAMVAMFGFIWVRTTWRAVRSEKKMQEMTMNLETANIKLTQLDRLKSEFLSFASHQIKAPMTVVKGYATLIMDGSFGQVSKQVGEVAEKIKLSADRMIGLVNSLLHLRRLEEGRMTYQFAEIEIGPLVVSVTDEMQQLAAHKGLKLVLKPAPAQWRINADEQHLRQVLQNLVDNAIKYTDKGSVTITLSEGPSRSVRIEVTDTGRGISGDLVPKLFEQFSRDQAIAREIAGTGLGLYIAKQMVIAHKGRIWVSSPGPGKGSTFTVELPHL
jgi:signal transduction histidine kinase